jgi:hypothetical protein
MESGRSANVFGPLVCGPQAGEEQEAVELGQLGAREGWVGRGQGAHVHQDDVWTGYVFWARGATTRLTIPAIICRICNTNVKKAGVLCQTCGLICHAACASSTTARCDVHEQYALYARQQEYLQSAASSRYVSPQPSMDDLEGNRNLQFPGKLLLGIKRARSSKAALRSSSSVDLAAETRRRRASNHASSSPAEHLVADRSCSTPTPEGHASHNSRQSRASVVSDISMASASPVEATEDGRRRSGLRLKSDGRGGIPERAQGVRPGDRSGAASPIGRGYPQPGTRSSGVKKDKSDCILQ